MSKHGKTWVLTKAAMTGAAALFLVWALGEAQAANRWYTARTVNGRTQPLSAGTTTMLLPDGRLIGIESATVSNALVDMVISLYNNPRGDDNGNTQGADAGSVEQDAYEGIIQYCADAIYEATEGQHSLRNVRVYRNASRQDADVIWQQAGGPSAWYMNQQGIAANINMFDQFSGVNFTNNAATQEQGGYTLAHECQHYLYGVLDEYCKWNGGWVTLPANEKTQPSIMNNQWAAAGRVYSWLNHSIEYNTNSVNYAQYECRNTTAQYQHYNDGAWPVLSRSPSNDPLDTARRQWLRTNRGARMYYPELATSAPTGTNPPAITLNNGTAVADLPSRDSLNIIWMGSNVVVEIILDHSGSMYGTPLANAKAAAQLLVDQVPDNSAVGVIKFDDTVTTVSPIIIVTSAVQRTTIKNAIAAITDSGATAIGDAAQEGLVQILAFGHTNFTRVAFLLSDGQDNSSSVSPMTAAANYANAQIPIMTFAYGSSPDTATLMAMANLTGGNFYYSPASLGAIAGAFNDAMAAIAANQMLIDGFYLASASSLQGVNNVDAAVSIPFQVDSTIDSLDVSVTYTTNNTATLTVNAPNGTQYQANSTNASGNERLLTFEVASPATGQWAIAGSVTTGATLRYSVSAGVTGFTYYLTASSVNGDTVYYPDPINIIARLTRGPSIRGAVVRAVITDPYSNTTYLALSNTNNDGTYSGLYLASNGLHSIVVEADNSAGTAMYTWSDTLPAVDSNGEVPIASDSAVGETFSRSASMQVTMSGASYATVPSAPTSVTASDGDYLGYVDVNWEADTYAYYDAASLYEIWRSTQDSSSSATKIGEIDRAFTNYMDSSVDVETRYYYWVKAKNVAGTSGFSSSARGWPIFGPAIGVNNKETLSLLPGNTAEVAVMLEVGSYTGYPCDWFIVAYADSFGLLYYLNSAGVWTQAYGVSDIDPVYQGGIFDISSPYTVFLYNALPSGVYHFYFALDWTVDGSLSLDTIVYDVATLTVTP
ncbi:MAG: VWA domain-containing protein [Lentisphaerae bacterium]|nr:VWA domain-containing protein [Lentisphaerota bacterium]